MSIYINVEFSLRGLFVLIQAGPVRLHQKDSRPRVRPFIKENTSCQASSASPSPGQLKTQFPKTIPLWTSPLSVQAATIWARAPTTRTILRNIRLARVLATLFSNASPISRGSSLISPGPSRKSTPCASKTTHRASQPNRTSCQVWEPTKRSLNRKRTFRKMFKTNSLPILSGSTPTFSPALNWGPALTAFRDRIRYAKAKTTGSPRLSDFPKSNKAITTSFIRTYLKKNWNTLEVKTNQNSTCRVPTPK